MPRELRNHTATPFTGLASPDSFIYKAVMQHPEGSSGGPSAIGLLSAQRGMV